MYFDPTDTLKYRESTVRCATTPGIQFNTRHCHKCHQIKSIENGKLVRGTSRHNPSKFYCKDCK